MIQRNRVLVLLFLLLPLTSGCWVQKWARGPITVDENALTLSEIQAEQAALDTRLAKLETVAEEQTGILRAIRAEGSLSSDEISGSQVAVRQLYEDLRVQMESIQSSIDRIRLAQTRSGAAVTPTGEGAADDPSQGGGSTTDIDPQPLYNAAYLDLIRGNYATSLIGFQAYLDAYPNGAQSDDALYWIGECHVAEKRPAEALLYFRRVEEEFPESPRVPAALLKKGEAHRSLGQTAEARKVWSRLREKYPRSDEAPLAEQNLQQLATGQAR